MPRGCKLSWVMYEEQVINLTSNEMKPFDWTISLYTKSIPKNIRSERCKLRNDNNEFRLDVREYFYMTFSYSLKFQ